MEGITMEKTMTVKELREAQRVTRDFYSQNPRAKKHEILALAREAENALSTLIAYEEYGIPDDVASYAVDIHKNCYSLAVMIDKIEIPVDPIDE